MESAVTLANLLNKAKSRVDGYRLNYSGVKSIFEEYQRSRQERVALACSLSAMATRLQAMDSYVWKLLGLHVIPLFGEELEANSASELILGGEPLNFIDYKGKSGTIPWEGWTTNVDPFPNSDNIFVKAMNGSKYLTCILLTSLTAWRFRPYKSWAGSPKASLIGPINVSSMSNSSTSSQLSHFHHQDPLTVIDPWATLIACMNLLPIGVIIAAESLRRGNVKSLSIV